MNEFLERLKNIFPNCNFKDNDIDILENCIDGIYNENDFIWACKQLFKNTKSKTIKVFDNKEIFIRYRNMNRLNFPNWIDDLTKENKEDLIENYKIIVGYCFLDWNQYNCNHPDILELIQAYHKDGIPYWCISSYIKEKVNLINNIYYIKKEQLLDVMNKSEDFKSGCRDIFRRQRKFKEYLNKEGINFIESVGIN